MGASGPPDNLVGRADDVRGVLALVRQSRLVTLIGTGGVGKTRLAREVASELETEFDRVEFADLTRQSVAEVFDGFVGDALLVIDNCEHVIESAAETIGRSIEMHEGMTVVATSRSPLRIAGERLFPVRLLTVPPAESPLADLHAWEAVELFLERAVQLDPEFGLDETNATGVAEICRLSSGLPLAIELAAGLTRSRPIERIVEAMGSSGGSEIETRRRDQPSHHQSVAESVDWSLRLIGADERELLQGAAVFRGSFTSDALAVVCGAVPQSLVDAVVEQSLMSFDRDTGRLSLLALVADAIRSATPSERVRSLADQHLIWARSLANEISHRALEPDPTGSFPSYVHDLPDLAHAAEVIQSQGDVDAWVDLVGPIAQWWVHHGGRVDRSLWANMFESSSASVARVGLAVGLAFHLGHAGDQREAVRVAESEQALASDLGRLDLHASLLIALGNAHHSLGENQAARNAFAAALHAGADHGSRYLEAIATIGLARISPDEDEQRRRLEQAIDLAGPDHPAVQVVGQQGLARLELAAGRVASADALAERSSETAERLGYDEAIATALNTKAAVAFARGDLLTAESLHRDAIERGQKMGHTGVIADGLIGLSKIAAVVERPEITNELASHARRLVPDIAMPAEFDSTDVSAVPERRLRDVLAGLELSPTRLEPSTDASVLTERETSVLLLLRGDLTQREIADELYVSASTVRTHVKSIYRKLDVHNRASCIHQGTVLGLLPPPR